jgi:hypothetical protein
VPSPNLKPIKNLPAGVEIIEKNHRTRRLDLARELWGKVIHLQVKGCLTFHHRSFDIVVVRAKMTLSSWFPTIYRQIWLFNHGDS